MQARPLSATRTVWSRTPGVVALLYPSVAAHKLSNSPLLFSRAFTSHDSGRSGHDGSWGGGRSSWWGAWSSTGWAVALVGGASQVALCDGKDEVKGEKEAANAMLDTMWPLISQLGFGSAMGWATGMAIQKVGRFVGFFVGMTFMAVQAASYQGYIDVNWNKAGKDFSKLLDINQDGQLVKEDAKMYLAKFMDVTTCNLPSAGGILNNP
ncbi:FUN14 family-domain-containing protein [Baffinella frigidus]|nr:FUN14 family-domain-containing protein [Cryptophyta sp. CCMP2293]